ncbi:hypothetical protein ACKFKF_30870 [Phormidesmis sp. 146-12]
MSFIRTKTVKGHSYEYLVENYRDPETKKVKQRVLKYLGKCKKLGTTEKLPFGTAVSLSLYLDGQMRAIVATVAEIPYCPPTCVVVRYMWSDLLHEVQVPRSKVSSLIP